LNQRGSLGEKGQLMRNQNSKPIKIGVSGPSKRTEKQERPETGKSQKRAGDQERKKKNNELKGVSSKLPGGTQISTEFIKTRARERGA